MTSVMPYPKELSSLISTDTQSTSTVDLVIASAIVQAKSTCHIRKGVVIRCLNPKIEAEVLQSFYIQLLPVEEGFIATSDIADIYELEPAAGDAVLSYLYSLVDEFNWLEKEEGNLSDSIGEELKRIRKYIRIV